MKTEITTFTAESKLELLAEIDKLSLNKIKKLLKADKLEAQDQLKILALASKVLKDNSFVIMPVQNENKDTIIADIENLMTEDLPFQPQIENH